MVKDYEEDFNDMDDKMVESSFFLVACIIIGLSGCLIALLWRLL